MKQGEWRMILRILIGFIIFYLLYRVAKILFLSPERRPERPPTPQQIVKGEDLVEDPCCHTYVPVSSAYRASIDGKTVYFCSQKCFEMYRSQKTQE